MKRSNHAITTAASIATPPQSVVEIITPEPMSGTTFPATVNQPHPSQRPPSSHNNHNSHQYNNWQYMTRTIAHYERLEQIGLGTYGQVYRAICKDTGRIVAMKKMRNSTSSTANTATSNAPVHQPTGMPLQLIREIKILKQLQHPNLLSMIEVVTSKGVEHLDIDDPIPISSSAIAASEKAKKKSKKDDKGRDKTDESKKEAAEDRNPAQSQEQLNAYRQERLDREQYRGNLFLVLEYMTHDLTGLLDVAYEFTIVQIKCIMKQLLLALQYMHEHKYIHRDIKSSNILLDSFFHLKLADFGLARSLEPPLWEQVESYSSGTSHSTHAGHTSQDLTNKVITLWYRPPEILLGTVHYGCAVDVWSAGCILAELITGKPLATGKTELDQLTLVADLTGTPTNPDTWEYLLTLKKSRSTPSTISNLATEWSEGEPRQSKLRDKYGPNSTKHRQIPETALTLLEKVLEWDPRKRITAANALQHRYFWSQPVAPDNPAELGRIAVAEDGHFHEFVTKQKRKQAKQLAEQSRDTALRSGVSTSIANEKYDEIYMGIMKQVAQEGFKNDDTKTEEEVVVPVAPEVKTKVVDDDYKHRGSDRPKGDGSSINHSRRDRKYSRGGEPMMDGDDNDESYDKDDRRRAKKKRSSDKGDERSSSRSHRRYSDDSEYRSEKSRRRSRKESYEENDDAPDGSDIKHSDRESSNRNQDLELSEKEKKSKKHSHRDSDSGRSKKDRHSRKSDREGGKKLNELVDNTDRRDHDDRYHRRVSDRDREHRDKERNDVDRYRRPTELSATNIPPPAASNRNDFVRPYDHGPPSRGGDTMGGYRRPEFNEAPPRTSGGGVYGDYRTNERRDITSAGPVYGDYRPKDRRVDTAAPHHHRHNDPMPSSRHRERDGPSGSQYNTSTTREFGDRYQTASHQRRDVGPGPYQHGRDGPGRGNDRGPRDSRAVQSHDDYPRRDRDAGPRGDYVGATPHATPGSNARRDGPVYGSDQFYRRDGSGGRRPESSDLRHPRERNR